MEKAKNSLIRTYGRKHGKKLSARQQNLIDAVLPTLLPNDTEGAILEIGFGNGEHLILLAEQNPDKIIIGAEPFVNGVAQMLSKITDEKNHVMPQYKNIRIWPDDVRKLPALAMGGGRFESIYILHPDPWPKARHEKRRLLSVEFLRTLASKVPKGGRIIVGTDHADYYDWILEQANAANLEIKRQDGDVIKTKYQEKNLFGSKQTMYLTLFPKA